ncbi:MAG: glutathione S-transferase N-terminal domain-containing protein [Pseudomonadales bacterium]|nr:glutathione S-transferase N-terminal domain-containing protein [Pseudomonadales bacterium]
MRRALDLSASLVVSFARNWRGSVSSKQDLQPKKAIKLYDRENCGECRLVREALTELNLNVDIYPCPVGGKCYLPEVDRETGHDKVPFLWDENTGEKVVGAERIVSYLYRQYKQKAAPAKYTSSVFNSISNQLADAVRRGHGDQAKPAKRVTKLLTLYSFESSPYSRLVRERLCEYELPYHLINIGKQQMADVGPANLRMTLKPYRPIENTKRWDFWKAHGNVQVPYIIDPNTNTAMFESEEILGYLDNVYGL